MSVPPPIIPEATGSFGSFETVGASLSAPRSPFLIVILSLFLAAFVLHAAVSFLDDALALAFRFQLLAAPRGLLTLAAALLGLVVLVLAAFTRRVPKRCFVPLALFNFLAPLLLIPLLIYQYERLHLGAWILSAIQLAVALGALAWARGGLRSRWPLVAEERLGPPGFRWGNLIGFVLANLCVLLPAIVLYLAFCASLAVGHFSGGFLALQSDGLTAKATRFIRDDGKSIKLIPMMHIGEPAFYARVTRSFPTNALVLLEGVTDQTHLIQEKLSYKRLASSLGLVEQQSGFEPGRAQGNSRRADVDVSVFSKSTIELLNLAARIHAEGFRSQAFLDVVRRGEDPALGKQLWEDILTGRNRHLLEEIQTGLQESDVLVVPWGAAHMPGVAEGIRQLGFKSAEIQEFKVVLFRTVLARLFLRLS